MKIALCKSHFAGPVSGADETLVTYAVRLREAGHDVRVVLMHKHAEDDPHYRRLRWAGVEVSCVVRRSLAFALLRRARELLSGFLLFFLLMPRSPARLRKVWQVLTDWLSRLHYPRCRAHLAALRPDLLHVFTPDTGAALMIRAGHELGIPVLYHELGTPHHLPALGVYYRRLEKVLPLCAEFAALSPRLAAQWAERFPSLERVSVLPLVVDDCAPCPSPARRGGETVFGYAARVEEGKGPLVLVEALAELRRGGAPAVVRVAGTGPQLPEVTSRALALGLGDSCDFAGLYTEPVGRSAFMRSLDVFMLPSLAEGTPNSIIEAMAHGLPVIASDVGGIPDLLTAETGILVPPGDAAALAGAMRRLASDPDLRAAMGRAARERYLKLCSPDAVLPVLWGTYLRVAGTRAPKPAAPRAGTLAHPWDVAAEF